MLNLLTGCAASRQSSETTVARSTGNAPWWKQIFGWLFGCAVESAYDYGSNQLRIQSGDPTR